MLAFSSFFYGTKISRYSSKISNLNTKSAPISEDIKGFMSPTKHQNETTDYRKENHLQETETNRTEEDSTFPKLTGFI